MSPSKKCVESDVKSDSECSEKQQQLSAVNSKFRDEIQRKIHNGVEKRRKDKINAWINKISELLPFKDPRKESKNENELKECRKRIRELETTNSSYYKLLRVAGISPCAELSELWKHPPTKYSNKLSEQQVDSLLKKMNEENDSPVKSLSPDSTSTREKEEKTQENSTSISLQNNTPSSSSSSASSVLVLNESIAQTTTTAETDKAKVRNSTQLQIHPSSVQLIPGTNLTCDNGLTNNILSGQIIIGPTVISPQQQPPATALLLPNGQILPVVNQSQPSLIYAPTTGLVLTSPHVNQLTTIQTNINTNITPTNVTKPTTVVEAVLASPEPEKPAKTSKNGKHDKSNSSNKASKLVNMKKTSKNNARKLSTKNDQKNDTKDEGKNKCKQVSATNLVKTNCSADTGNLGDILAKATESIFSPASTNKSDDISSNNSADSEVKNKEQSVKPTESVSIEKETDQIKNNSVRENDEEPPSKKSKKESVLTTNQKDRVNDNDLGDKPETNKQVSGSASEIFHENRNEDNLVNDQDSELPSLLGSLTEDNVISPESVNSVSNSNLSAFLSLSPSEQLSEFLVKETTSSNNVTSSQSLMSVSNLIPTTASVNVGSSLNSQHPYIPSLNNFNSDASNNPANVNLSKDIIPHTSFINKTTVQKHLMDNGSAAVAISSTNTAVFTNTS
ncbi:hypothetical protein B4U79_16227 [Dinothrombium tinctorium]|uniref:BHLH domain-containing protein n=1 Tax=Dinothrombium tinctorium TaxID=1965070 RepID=A0A443RNU0_9ACAR|nr:hypothetical protein B4U79_16227 [Dinothrombium tinctorium]